MSCEWDEGRVVGALVLFSALRMLGHGYLIIFLGSRLTSDALVASRVGDISAATDAVLALQTQANHRYSRPFVC